MFIEGVSPDMHISDPSQLEIGMELWSVGQGGSSPLCSPSLTGTVVGINRHRSYYANEIVDKDNWILYDTDYGQCSTSMLDNHILPQSYNNWYFCSSREQAEALYVFLAAAWEANPAYEIARQAMIEEDRYWVSMDDRDDWYYDRDDDYDR